MTAADRADILTKLSTGRDALLASVEGLSEADAIASPAPGQWSIVDNIEHLAIVETNLLRNIEQASPLEGESRPGREQAIFEGTQSRERKLHAPPQARPAGRCSDLSAALKMFDESRTRTVQFVESCGDDLRLRMTKHPLLGPVTGLECISLIAAHPIRHAKQILEIRGLSG
jgi:uncharacterized damage-inducible protein DinB